MGKEAFCVIIYSVGAITLYTVVICIGFYRARRQSKNSFDYLFELKHILEEIKSIIMKEETDTMDKEQYKNSRSSEMISVSRVAEPIKAVASTLTLSDIINRKATEDNYVEIVELLTDLFRQTYREYKFMVAKAQRTSDANFMQLVSRYEDSPGLHTHIFRKAIDYGIEMRKLQEKFAEHVAAGKVLDLGKDVVVITDDGTISLPTGVSPINSGVEGGEITAIITFIHKDYFQEWSDSIKKEN